MNRADSEAAKKDIKNPIQPLYVDEQGRTRFKSNEIVRFLLDNGGIDLNQIAAMDFTDDDREQFSQLHGYTLNGFAELHSTSDETYYAAVNMFENPEITSLQARYEALESQLASLKEALKGPIAELYGIHPDDLTDR